MNGKQHGIGAYVSEEKNLYGVKEHKKKYGLWQEGKRLIWFNSPDQVKNISKGIQDYKTFFTIDEYKNTNV